MLPKDNKPLVPEPKDTIFAGSGNDIVPFDPEELDEESYEEIDIFIFPLQEEETEFDSLDDDDAAILTEASPPSIAHVFGAPVPVELPQIGIGSVADFHDDGDLIL